jgi:hypothetical protein
MSTATHADELLVYVAEADLKHATIESLLALLFQNYRPTAHKLI